MLYNLIKKEDPKFHDEMVAKCRQGFWAVNQKGFPIKIENGEEFAYMQSMEERVVPIVFTKLCFDEDGAYLGCCVSNFDPQTLVFALKNGVLQINYNDKYRGGFGFGLYADDAEPEDKDDNLRFSFRDRALEECRKIENRNFERIDTLTEII